VALADDATGALEVGAKFAAAGLECVVEFGAPRFSQTAVVIDTETRRLESAQAAAIVEDAAREARRRGIEYLYKKTDSTLRGNIAAELAAVRRVYSDGAMVYAPAYPAMGRTARNGVVYVHGEALGSAAALLADAVDGNVTLWDAETQADLEAVPHSDVAAGTGGFAGIWASRLDVPRLAARRPFVRGPCLVVNGSLHPASLAQVGRPGNIDISAEALVSEIATGGSAILATAAAPRMAPEEAARLLGATAAAVVRRLPVCTLVIFGGDTTRAVLRELRVHEVEPVCELLEGIPAARFCREGRDIGLVTKAGGFGGPRTLTDILEKLG
jgi:uncharacterized protein YgbK (DUF1537 family)